MDPIRAQLGADHRILDDLFCRLLHDVGVLSQRDVQSAWSELEHRLLSHLDVEEQCLFPLVEPRHRAELARCQDEHVRIRGLICALGIAIELHHACEPAIRELSHVLHKHAEREDRLLHRLTCERASAAVQYRMAASLRSAARAAHEAAVRTLANRSGSQKAVGSRS